MNGRIRLTLMTDDPDGMRRRYIMAPVDEQELTLGDLLAAYPALSAERLTEEHLRAHVQDLRLTIIPLQPDKAGYTCPGLRLSGGQAAAGQNGQSAGESGAPAAESEAGPRDSGDAGAADDTAAGSDPDFDLAQHPERITDREAVILAHRDDIERAASYLEAGLSVLIRCDKVLVSHLGIEIAARSGRQTRILRVEPGAEGTAAAPLPGLAPSRRNELLDQLLSALTSARPGELIVIPHLDLLAGGNNTTLSAEARELTDAVYEQADCLLLGFIDPSLSLPEVLANRFAVRLAIDILPRLVRTSQGSAPVGRALVTQREAELFGDFDEVGLYKHVAGLNAVRLRHGLRFAAHQYEAGPADGQADGGGPGATAATAEAAVTAEIADGPGTPDEAPDRDGEAAARRPKFRQLVAELQTFKAKTSNSFEVPNVSFDAIGGYTDVKTELRGALAIIGGASDLPEHLRTELVPAGFIFHGPPGTGKTLFAKAVATQLGATILVVSGPEITDKYVGESERKIRDLFAEARRNAPSVVVFDEFDSIAVRRSGGDDGGARAGNAIVAQLLTELDGFRPEVPVLIIGTTNRLDLIDEALLRPSRFRPIPIGLPESDARRDIAKYHAKYFGVLVNDTLLDKIAAATEQFSGDDIRSLFRDARAGELVGKGPAGEWRLGQLVGELRRGRQERDVRRNSAAPVATAGGRRGRLSEQSMGAVVIRRPVRSDAAVPPGGTQPADSPAGGAGEGERQP